VFYFGNAIGETGNRATLVKRRPPDARVNKADVKVVKRERRIPGATLVRLADFDRNGVVDTQDVLIAKRNRTGTKRVPALVLIIAP
jgi:hypothetical protein